MIDGELVGVTFHYDNGESFYVEGGVVSILIPDDGEEDIELLITSDVDQEEAESLLILVAEEVEKGNLQQI